MSACCCVFTRKKPDGILHTMHWHLLWWCQDTLALDSLSMVPMLTATHGIARSLRDCRAQRLVHDVRVSRYLSFCIDKNSSPLVPDLARLSCPFFSLLVCVSGSMLPMFLPSLPIRFSLPTIYHHVRTMLLCLPFPPDFPPCPSCCLFYCFLSTRMLRNRKFACTAEESRLFTNPKQHRSFASRSPQCMTLIVDDTCWYTMHVDSQGNQIPRCEHVA